MPRYSNGNIPPSALVQFDTGGGQHVGTVGIRDRWYQLRSNVKARYGKTLQISSGWNVYRPYDEQVVGRANACASGNCAGAAVPGSSSHGGNWGWQDALAIDVGNYSIIGRDAFYEEARRVGFVAGAITEAVSNIPGGEPWHIIDLDPYRVLPAPEKPLTAIGEDEVYIAIVKHGGIQGAFLVTPQGSAQPTALGLGGGANYSGIPTVEITDFSDSFWKTVRLV